jgi:hypothetical protein
MNASAAGIVMDKPIITRTFDAAWINAVANHPDVTRWVRGWALGPIDITAAVADRNNVALIGEFGGVFFVKLQPGLYEFHAQVLPAGRGRWTLRMMRAALAWMFARTDAVEMMARIPRGNLAALTLIRALKGVKDFHLPRGWIVDLDPVPADVYGLRIQDWMRTAPELPLRGRWMRDRLAQELKRLGKGDIDLSASEDDERAMGLAMEMLLGGQPEKAVVFFDRYAAFTGCSRLQIVSRSPLVVSAGPAMLCIRNDDFWVMSCQ